MISISACFAYDENSLSLMWRKTFFTTLLKPQMLILHKYFALIVGDLVKLVE